mgnify:CR=1 FL=1
MAGQGVNVYTRFLRLAKTHDMDPEVCWEWVGAGKGNGYGSFNAAGATTPAHRYAYMLFCGPIGDGLDVCHTCDNRCCVNPDHLFTGTRAENMADMVAKGRGDGGCRKHLKECTLQEIRRQLHAGVPMRRIAESLSVNYSTVSSIKRGASYGRNK